MLSFLPAIAHPPPLCAPPRRKVRPEAKVKTRGPGVCGRRPGVPPARVERPFRSRRCQEPKPSLLRRGTFAARGSEALGATKWPLVETTPSPQLQGDGQVKSRPAGEQGQGRLAQEPKTPLLSLSTAAAPLETKEGGRPPRRRRRRAGGAGPRRNCPRGRSTPSPSGCAACSCAGSVLFSSILLLQRPRKVSPQGKVSCFGSVTPDSTNLPLAASLLVSAEVGAEGAQKRRHPTLRAQESVGAGAESAGGLGLRCSKTN